MKKSGYLLLILLIHVGLQAQTPRLIQYVDPFIGTMGGSHNFPGATLPFGMVQVSPDCGNKSLQDYLEYRNGQQYDYAKNEIQGFGHLHLSGTANDPAGDLSVLPVSGLPPTAKWIKSRFSHQEEEASPGYYRVVLQSFGIQAELTAAQRCALHRYLFPAKKEKMIRFDLGYHNGAPPVESCFRKINDTTFVGYRYSTGYADDKRLFFAIRTNKPVGRLTLFADTVQVQSHDSVHAVGVKACLSFPPETCDTLLMKVAISFADIAGAITGLSEVPDWNFEGVKREAERIWEQELERMTITTQNRTHLREFYTAVYHCYLSSSGFSDATGRYRGPDGKIHTENDIYSVFGLWDTYRALFPLYTLTQQQRLPHLLRSFLAFYEQYGLLPVWEMAFCETHCMTGYHAVPILADAILKGVQGFDWNEAYAAMLASANQNIRNSDSYRKFGYVPFEASSASVTKTTEYAFDDMGIARVAAKLGKSADERLYRQRSRNWQHLFDVRSGFIRPKYADGSWVPGFDPFSDQTNGKECYTEGNAWHYTFMVPQDLPGLIQAFGSPALFVQKLDSFFTLPYPTGNYLAGMGGLIGQYAHGNQPSQHLPFLYAYAGYPEKTAERAHQILTNFYKDAPDGIIGNEDTGGMSSWFVWNAAGLFPANPVGGEYIMGSPLSDRTVIRFRDGKQFTIATTGRSDQNIYITGAILNGKRIHRAFIRHSEMVSGGTLLLEMGDHPDPHFGKENKDLPGLPQP
ncbi:MAG: GH92 family glycosyl hydrolase [Marinilabiliales bacterium]|nr:GH92 family glycosyl hydrolase [Marinilabiliales bacterium]